MSGTLFKKLSIKSITESP
jgi:hypothetical protein